MILFGILGLLWLPSIALTISQAVKPNFARSWAIAIVSASLALLATFFLRLFLPMEVELIRWLPESLYHSAIAFRIDYINWHYMVAILALCVSVILTDSSRTSTNTTPTTWAAALALTGLNLIAVMSRGPLTMAIAWAVTDLVELVYVLIIQRSSGSTGKVTTTYGVRLISTFVLVAATAVGWQVTAGLDFTQIPPTASLLFLVAAGLRLGVLPLSISIQDAPDLKRGTALLLRFSPVVSALVLIAHLPSEILVLNQSLVSIISVLTILAALYASAMWLTRIDANEGRPYWIVALSAFALESALNGQPENSRVWGLALLLSGGVLFLFDPPIRRIRFIPLLGLIGLVGIPYTLAASGWSALLGSQLNLAGIAMIFCHAMLVGGYLRYILEANSTVTGLEKYARITYPLGLILLIQTMLVLNLVGWLGVLTVGTWWGSAASLGLVLLGGFLAQKLGLRLTSIEFKEKVPFYRLGHRILNALRVVFSLDWVYTSARWLFARLSDVAGFFRQVLEGDAGVLWSLFFLLVIATLIYTQVGRP
jgi:hypothetical protein